MQCMQPWKHAHTYTRACMPINWLQVEPCTARSGTARQGVRPKYTYVHLAVLLYFGFACMPHHASACTLGHGAGPPPHQGQCTCLAPQALATAGRMLAVGLRRMAGKPTSAHKPQPSRVIPWHNNLNWGECDCSSLFEAFYFPHWKQALACQSAGPR